MPPKLTASQRRSIIALYNTGEYTLAQLGRQFGVTRQAIDHILKHRSVNVRTLHKTMALAKIAEMGGVDRLLEEGWTWDALAAEADVSPTSLHRWLQPSTNARTLRRQMALAKIAALGGIDKLVNEGWSWDALAAEAGASPTSLRRWLKQAVRCDP